MAATEHVTFEVRVNDERTDPADFALFVGAGELPRVRLFDALAELVAMDHLEAFEGAAARRCAS